MVGRLEGHFWKCGIHSPLLSCTIRLHAQKWFKRQVMVWHWRLVSWWTASFYAPFVFSCSNTWWTYIISSLCFVICHLFGLFTFLGFVSLFAVYTHAGQDFFFFGNFFIHSLYSCGLGVFCLWFLSFTVYTLTGQECFVCDLCRS